MDIDEKRVYAHRTGKRDVHVATEAGVVTVEVSGAQAGGYALAHRCTARDVATGHGLLVVATDEDVLVGESFEPSEFGHAVAVTVAPDGAPVAAGPDGRVARLDEDGWAPLSTIEGVRALDGALVAAADGVHRLQVAARTSTYVGLDDARDVATADAPLAATGDGLYRLGNGWLAERDGAFEVVTGDPGEPHAHAATADALYAYWGDGWRNLDPPVEASVADVAYGECVYAATEDGTFLVFDPDADAWTPQPLGTPGVAALAVAETETQ
jgi:hypothetical protein